MRKIFIDAGAYIGDSIEKFQEIEKDHDDFEIHAFEANPELWHHFDNLDVILHKNAVWIEDGEVDFYIGKNDVSSTIVQDKVSGEVDYDNPIKVQGIDIDKWIKENFTKEDKIILKMDIEGGEFVVIPHMIKNGSINYLDEIWIEMHPNKVTKYLSSDRDNLIKDIKDTGIVYKKWH